MSWEKPRGVERSQMRSPMAVMEQAHAAGQTGQNLLRANLLCRKSPEVPVSNSQHEYECTSSVSLIRQMLWAALAKLQPAGWDKWFLCLWDHAWRTVSCFGLLVQDRQGHTEANPTQGHQDGQGTGAYMRGWENSVFVLRKRTHLIGMYNKESELQH